MVGMRRMGGGHEEEIERLSTRVKVSTGEF